MPRLLKWIAALLLLAWLAGAAALYLAQARLLYHPEHSRVDPAQTDYSLSRDGLTLRGWVVNPGQPRALIYYGGNGDAVQNYREDYARWAPDRSVYLLAYRGYGASEGSPGQDALFGDALALYDAVRARHASVAVVGRSLGSGVATWVAAQRPLEKLVLVTPFDSIARIAAARFPLFPVNLLIRDRYDSFRYAPSVHCPLLVLVAAHDQVVPADSTARLLPLFTPAPRVITIPGSGHGDIVAKPAYGQAVAEFLR
jgi:pimeloyl-ACP methyl ester carboxylesterase